MIKDSTVEVKISSRNRTYWERIVKHSISESVVSVSVDLLPTNSNIYVTCICDVCGKEYSQRFSRDHSNCGKCKLKKRLQGNNLGAKNTKYSLPTKDEFVKHIESGFGKKRLAEIYSVSIPVINSWLKKHDIDLQPYHGRKFFKSNDEHQECIKNVSKFLSSGDTIAEISRKLNLPRQIINKIIRENKLKVNTVFTKWKDQYEEILQNFDLYKEENRNITLKEISEKYSISVEQLKRAFKEKNVTVRIHSYNKSKGELECRDFIRSLGFKCDSYKFEKKYEIDCYVAEKNFGVEYCGEYWHRFVPAKNNKQYHAEKHQYFLQKNIRLFTIFENEWKDIRKRKILESMISQRLGVNTKKVFARKCIVQIIPREDAQKFHDCNHISGHSISSINIGLYYDDQLISVLSLSKSRFDKLYEYEIARFSSQVGHVVVGGFSKMFSFFIKNYSAGSCMTYADLRFGEGNVYERSGFTLLGRTMPNYFYYDKNTGNVENRMKFQKKKLKKMNIPEYSDNKTEFEIMSELGYYKLYDCGNKKYGWRRTPPIPMTINCS